MNHILLIFLYLCSFTLYGAGSKDCLEVRAAFDVGSGSTKLKVFEWNKCHGYLIKELSSCEDHKKVSYKESLNHSKVILPCWQLIWPPKAILKSTKIRS